MTTLVSWITYSTTGERPELPRAIYIASDSRITWGSESLRWDAGKKVFNSRSGPHIFGYCGDVVFPSLVLGQIVAAIDNEILFENECAPDQKHECIFETIKNSYHEGLNHPVKDFSILHAYRTAAWPNTEFFFWHISYKSKTKAWVSEKLLLPEKTGMIISLGSGAASAKSHERHWKKSDVGGTSRSFFSAFCDAIDSGDDKLSGGAPQLCALYPAESPKSIGIVKGNRYFLHGMEVPPGSQLSNVEWKDNLFQNIDPETNMLKKGARPFVRPALK